eukprot:6741256-Prymnesium_polylepis.2
MRVRTARTPRSAGILGTSAARSARCRTSPAADSLRSAPLGSETQSSAERVAGRLALSSEAIV